MLEDEGRLLVAAANRRARQDGIAPGMALADARAILPALETVPAEPAADAQALARLARWCGRYGPWTAVDPSGAAADPIGAVGGDGAAWLDVTGCAHLVGGEAALLADLTGRLRDAGHGARAAIADTPGAAWAVARFAPARKGRPWTVVPPGGAAAALAPLSVAALRLTPETATTLESLGLRHIGELVTLPRAALAARFRDEVAVALDRALGRRPEPLSPLAPETPRFARLAFAEPIGRSEDLARALDYLLATLCATLECAGLGARRLVLGVYEPDGDARHIEVGTSRPSRAPAHLARLFAERLDDVEAAFGVDAMTLAAPAAEPLDPAQAGLEGDTASADQTGALVDRLANRLGAGRVVRLAARASHMPERAQRAVSALDDAALIPAAWPTACRPLRLLPRPEPIEAIAPVPDDPPALFRWRRVLHRVARADGPERIAPEWWLDAAPADAAAARDYYRVEDVAGQRFWVFRQGLYRPGVTPAWFLHGVFE